MQSTREHDDLAGFPIASRKGGAASGAFTMDDAMARLDSLFADEPEARELCLAYWPEGQAHVDWFCTATEQDIRDWVEDVWE